MSTFEEHIRKLDIVSIIITSNLTAFGIVLAFLWKDVLTELFAVILPHGGGLFSLFMTAMAGTIFIVFFAYFLTNTKHINRKNIYSFKERVKVRSYKPGKIRKIREAFNLGSKSRYKYKASKKLFSF